MIDNCSLKINISYNGIKKKIHQWKLWEVKKDVLWGWLQCTHNICPGRNGLTLNTGDFHYLPWEVSCHVEGAKAQRNVSNTETSISVFICTDTSLYVKLREIDTGTSSTLNLLFDLIENFRKLLLYSTEALCLKLVYSGFHSPVGRRRDRHERINFKCGRCF